MFEENHEWVKWLGASRSPLTSYAKVQPFMKGYLGTGITLNMIFHGSFRHPAPCLMGTGDAFL
jgi:hypothetical protein